MTIDEVIDQYGKTIQSLGYGRRELAKWLNENLEGKYTEHYARRLLAEMVELYGEEVAPVYVIEEAPGKSHASMEEKLREIYGLDDPSWVPVSAWGDPNNPRAKWERKMDLLQAEKMQVIAQKYAEYPTPIEKTQVESEEIAVLSIRDTHFGMFTDHPGPYETYDVHEAQASYLKAAEYLMGQTSLDCDTLVIPFGSDTLHVDGQSNSTTRGTMQETSTAWWRAFEAAIQSLNIVTDMARETFPNVILLLEQGNHDHNMARALAMAVKSRWGDVKGVTVMDGFESVKRISIGDTHLFFHHGDSVNIGQYPVLIYADHPDVAKPGSYVEVLSGHLHHRKKATLKQPGDYLEDGGIVTRITPALCPASNWAEAQGYRSVPGAQLTTYTGRGFKSLYEWTPTLLE